MSSKNAGPMPDMREDLAPHIANDRSDLKTFVARVFSNKPLWVRLPQGMQGQSVRYYGPGLAIAGWYLEVRKSGGAEWARITPRPMETDGER